MPVSPTRLLVLGVTHLGRGDEHEPATALATAVDRIAAWRPDAIAIEALPAELVGTYRRLGGPWDDLQVGGFPQAVACAEAVRGLHDWDLWQARRVGADPGRTPSERVVAWCAAYEPYTALLHAEDAVDLPAGVIEALDGVRRRGDERWRIAGAAARRLGLTRLYPFDDHSNWALLHDIADERYHAVMTPIYERARSHPGLRAQEEALATALSAGDLWPHWRNLNSPAEVADSEELESGSFLAAGDDEIARRSLAGWRMRNLLMAGRLRAVTGEHPGGRVLAVVGQAHKGPLESALGRDQWDLEIVDVAELERVTTGP